jgi:hypothetical protein
LVLGQRVSSGARLLISWSEPSRAGAVTPVNDVGEAFKRVFGRAAEPGECTSDGGLVAPSSTTPSAGASSATSRNVLDVVAADLKALKAELPSWSRTALDDQLDAINELQAKALQTSDPSPAPSTANLTGGGTSEGCYAAGTSEFSQRSNYMSDLIVSALQSGTRRVAVFQQGTASGDNFSVPNYGGYHGEVHNLSSGAVGDLARVTRMQTDLFKDIGYFVDRLAATKDASGQSLLDNTLVYICTEFSPFGASNDPHNTGSGLVLNLIGASNHFNTRGQAISAKGPVGGVLRQVAQYMGLGMGTGFTADNLGKFDPTTGITRG